MKRKNSLAAAFLSVILLLNLCGCGAGTESKPLAQDFVSGEEPEQSAA